jgi:hypothetical protein
MAEPRSLPVDFLCPSEGCKYAAKDLSFLQVHLHSKNRMCKEDWMWPTKAKLLDSSYVATLRANNAYKV